MKALHYLLSLGIVIYSAGLQATWIIVKINNQSDLTFVQAVRTENNVEIQSISQKLRPDNRDVTTVNLDADAFFGSSGGCKIEMRDAVGASFFISFFGDLRHRVANGRARFADRASKDAAARLKLPMMARVFCEHAGQRSLIGSAGYEKENQQFALTLLGKHGNYTAKLTLAS